MLQGDMTCSDSTDLRIYQGVVARAGETKETETEEEKHVLWWR